MTTDAAAERGTAVGLPKVGAAVGRIVATAQNGLEVIRLGGLETGTQPAPFRVVETEKMFRLRRYFPDDAGDGASHIILIPPMMVSANVYDVTENNGAVSVLHRHGIIPWVIDFDRRITKRAAWNALSPTM